MWCVRVPAISWARECVPCISPQSVSSGIIVSRHGVPFSATVAVSSDDERCGEYFARESKEDDDCNCVDLLVQALSDADLLSVDFSRESSADADRLIAGFARESRRLRRCCVCVLCVHVLGG